MKQLIIAFLLALPAVAQAQCSYKNEAFQSGEFLSYNLYYNWKFVWVKAGTASMSVVQSTYKGKEAYRGSLITRGSSRADNFFVLRDTLLCYSSLDMVPLYFRKGAREGKRYNVDEVFYSYPNDKVQTRQYRQRTDGSYTWQTNTHETCVYDMMNIFLRARSFNPEGWKKGNEIKFPIVDGRSKINAKMVYRGKSVVKGDNGKRYRCLELSYIETEDGETKEIARFFVSDDSNHVPVRIDMNLKFGSAKAFVVGMKGLKNAVASEVK